MELNDFGNSPSHINPIYQTAFQELNNVYATLAELSLKLISYTGVHGFESRLCFQFLLSAILHPGKQQVMFFVTRMGDPVLDS